MIDSRTLAETAVRLSQGADAEKNIDAFIAYLSEHNLTGLLPQVLVHAQRMSNQESKDAVLHITSKYALSDAERDQVIKVTGAQNATVEQHIDENLVGGFSATYEGHIYDGSLSHQITRLKTVLTR